jgi:CRISPR-associated endonuclease Cas1
MQTSVTESDSAVRYIFTRQPDNPSVIVADGFGVRVSINRGHLVIEDGIGDTRRIRRIPRIDATMSARSSDSQFRIARLVILSDSGYVSFEALRWCADLGISVVQLDRDGRLLMSSPGLAGDSRLRIAQVRAIGSETGVSIIRALMAEKLSRQAQLLRDIFGATRSAEKIERNADIIRASDNLNEILATEGSSAAVYWRAWRGNVFVPFRPQDLQHVPSHWYEFKSRASLRNPLRQGKNATDPINAMLNYAYAIAETEAKHACHIVGLDPAIGYGHGHHDIRDALAFDLMEVLRPEADRAVLSILGTGKGVPYASDGKPAYFDALDFIETRDATCRIDAPVTHRLCEIVPAAVASLAGIHAENISRQLASSSAHKLRTRSYVHRASPARLHVVSHVRPASDLQPSDVLSDDAWRAVLPLIPPEPVSIRHKQPRSDARAVLAGILCHEIMKVSWRAIPASFGVRGETCRRRLIEWTALGAWPAILSVARPERN